MSFSCLWSFVLYFSNLSVCQPWKSFSLSFSLPLSLPMSGPAMGFPNWKHWPFFMKIDHQFCRREKGPEFRALACVRWSSCFSAGCWQSCCLFSTRPQWAGEPHEFSSLFNGHFKFLTFFWDLTTSMVIYVFGCYLLCYALCFNCDFDRSQPVWLIWSLICSFCKFNWESFGIWDYVLFGHLIVVHLRAFCLCSLVRVYWSVSWNL